MHSGSSCLTGSAQIAIVAYRLSEITGETRYRKAAELLDISYKSLLNKIKDYELTEAG